MVPKKNLSKRKQEDINEDENENEDDDNELRINFNKIYFSLDINVKTASRLIKALEHLQEKLLIQSIQYDCNPLPILLFINSNGGEIHAAFSVMDFINSMKIEVHSIVTGLAASAATLISISCHKKYIESNAFMLIHELSGEIWGKMSLIEDEYKNLKKIMQKIILFYSENTLIKNGELTKLLQKDCLLNANECIQKGLADYIW